MAITALTAIPETFEAGNTVRFTESFSSHPSSAWSCALKLNRPGAAPVSIAGTPSGIGFAFVITAAVSTSMAVGQYAAAFYVTETASGERTTAKSATVLVTPNLGATVAKSQAVQTLEAIDAALLSLAGDKNSTVSFNGQSFTRKNLFELSQYREKVAARVLAEQRQASGASRNIQIRFPAR